MQNLALQRRRRSFNTSQDQNQDIIPFAITAISQHSDQAALPTSRILSGLDKTIITETKLAKNLNISIK